MNGTETDFRKLIRRIDHYAARLNPGLCAVAIVLSTALLAEAAVRLPALYAVDIAPQILALTSDPTAQLPVDVRPSE